MIDPERFEEMRDEELANERRQRRRRAADNNPVPPHRRPDFDPDDPEQVERALDWMPPEYR